jgi:hypothetical protein
MSIFRNNPQLRQVEAPLEPQSVGRNLDEAEDSESSTGDTIASTLNLEQGNASEDELQTTEAVELDGQPSATSIPVSGTRPECGELPSPKLLCESPSPCYVIPLSGHHGRAYSYANRSYLATLLPSTIDRQGQITCLSNHYLGQNGNWDVRPIACYRRLTTDQIYFRHVREVHLGCERKKMGSVIRSERSTEISRKRRKQVMPWTASMCFTYFL